MAVNLTGMLSQINQQMAPRQPAPQLPVEQQNLMQRSGVTDPLLQQFGQGLAGALGVETRSPMAQFGSALQDIDTSTPEGKKALLSALSKVDPLSAVKMGEAFRQEALDAPKRAAELARIQAQTELAKRQGEYRNISFVKEVEITDPITGAVTKRPQQFTVTVDSEGKIPESVLEKYGTIGITQEEIDSVTTAEAGDRYIYTDPQNPSKTVTIEFKKDEDGNVVPHKVISDTESVEVTPEYVDTVLEAQNKPRRPQPTQAQKQQGMLSNPIIGVM